MGCELAAIMWITRPCVAHCDELIMTCIYVSHVDPFAFHVLKLHYVNKGEIFKKDFMF